MTINAVKNPLLAISATKKFCRAAEYGFSVFGEAGFGEEFRVLIFEWFGTSQFGDIEFGDLILLSGIYHTRRSAAGRHTARLKYYRPAPATSPAALATRVNFAAAISGWQSLTTIQRMVYNKRAVGLHMSGYNVYIREFLSS